MARKRGDKNSGEAARSHPGNEARSVPVLRYELSYVYEQSFRSTAEFIFKSNYEFSVAEAAILSPSLPRFL